MVRLAILLMALVLNMSAQCVALCGAVPHAKAKPAPTHHCHTDPQQQTPDQDVCAHPTFVSEEGAQLPTFTLAELGSLPAMHSSVRVLAVSASLPRANSPPLPPSAPLSLRI